MSQFDIKGLPLIGAKIVKKIKHEDERGYLSRLFCIDELSKEKVFKSIKQINLTLTKKKKHNQGTSLSIPTFCRN